MSKIQGRLGRMAVSSDGAINYFILGCIIDMNLAGSAAEIKVTCHEDGQFEQYLQGRKEATVDGSAYWDEDDTGQNIVEDAFFNSTGLDVRFRMQEGTGKKEYEGKAIVTSWNESSPNDDAATVDFTLRINGDFTKSFQ